MSKCTGHKRKESCTNSAAVIVTIIIVIARAILAIGYSAVAAGITLNCDGIIQG